MIYFHSVACFLVETVIQAKYDMREKCVFKLTGLSPTYHRPEGIRVPVSAHLQITLVRVS